ncbi:carbonic anhydrase [uncultured Chitinophaga sp.]|jgi:Carbonic anhydrase|uniref:carbonic anhydrase n=1 Tax=uncultured Chitinophaga sp. TaxID=339340 RepID=UPI00260541DD|nr:carbonic anhydrase [uncultured Chitinophaga sp.]
MRKVRFITPTVLFIVIIFTLLISFSCHQPAAPDHRISSSNVLALLQEGNKRFHSHQMQHPHTNKQWMSTVSREQHPEAIIVCCSDSRVCPELVFDQGLGDLFVIRSAGNIISPVELGSIEYGVEHLGVHLIIIMGHERCGAIEAFANGELPHGYIKTLIDTLKNESEIKQIHDKSHFIEIV